MAKILVQVSLTENELPVVRDTLHQSLKNLLQCPSHKVHVLIVYQGRKKDSLSSLLALGADLVVASVYSVSHARNIGIDRAQIEGFDALLFHDASLIYSADFFSMLDVVALPGELVRAKIIWLQAKLKPHKDLAIGHKAKTRGLRIFSDSFVCAYIFDPKRIGRIRFNESMGPGNNSKISCGEDVLFMYHYCVAHNIKKVRVTDDVVYHPPRPHDLSKQLSYACGQGALYRALLADSFSRTDTPSVLLQFILFVINTFRYAIAHGGRGRLIALRRWQGFRRGVVLGNSGFPSRDGYR